ncbi:MAG TPA: peptidoglycan DD-metalloendopeptidase family protein [Ureibacillus sp.]|nr:peptidoglycan DD-metalloendopeptidase family protein [Ureibacillus sp.]
MKKWKWIGAGILCITVLLANYLQDKGQINVDIKKVVYSSEDLNVMRNVLQEMFGTEEDPTITVSSETVNNELLSFIAVKPYDEGYLLTFERTLPIIAIENGLVVYTGHNTHTGKTISVYYENNTTVTYGFVDAFTTLPYTSVGKGQTIANKEDPGDLYIQIETNGKRLNLEETIKWMREFVQS